MSDFSSAINADFRHRNAWGDAAPLGSYTPDTWSNSGKFLVKRRSGSLGVVGSEREAQAQTGASKPFTSTSATAEQGQTDDLLAEGEGVSDTEGSFEDFYWNLRGREIPTAAQWVNDFARKSASEFMSGGTQVIYQSLQDAGLALLGIAQNSILEQVQAGNDTITRPDSGVAGEDDATRVFREAVFGGIDDYLDRIFGDSDTISRSDLLNNDEFYEVGIRLATQEQRSTSGAVTWVATDQGVVDAYQTVDANFQQEKRDYADSVFTDLGYTATEDELYQFADDPEGISSYVDPRQVTYEEAAEIFQDTYGYEPNRDELEQFVGQGEAGFQDNQSAAIGEYVDPRQVTRAELEAIAEEQGYELSDEDYEEYVGQADDPLDDDYDRRRKVGAEVIFDSNAVTEAELVAIAEEHEYDLSELSDREREALIGNVVEDEVYQQLDEGAVTREELAEIAEREGYNLDDLTEEEIGELTGNIEESEVIEDIDARAVTIEEVQEMYKNRTGQDLDEESARQILMSAGYPVDENGNVQAGTLNERDFQEYINNVEMSLEENLNVLLQRASRVGQQMLDILFGKHPTGRSKTLEEIFKEQMERRMPPDPSDPDYERKFTEWLKRQSGSIISINHDIVDGVHDVWAGVRFPVPIPISGPEIKIPLLDEDGNFIGMQEVAEIFVNEVGEVVSETGQRIGQLAEDGIELLNRAGEVIGTVALAETGVDENGNPAQGVAGWKEDDPNPWEISEEVYNGGTGGVEDTGDGTGSDGSGEDTGDGTGSDGSGEEEDGLPISEEVEDTDGEEDPPDEDPPEGEVEDTDGEEDPPDEDPPVGEPPEGDRVAYLSDVERAKEEVLDQLGNQLSDLGVDIDDIDEVLERVESQLADVATTDDLRTLRESLETTLSEELAALGIDDIQGTLDSVNEDLDGLNSSLEDLAVAVGQPAVADDPNTDEDESRPATGIYAAIEEGDAALEEYMDGLIADVEALGVAVDDIPGLIDGIIESTREELEDLGYNQEQIMDLIGSPASEDAEATGLYAQISGLGTQISDLDTQLNDRIDQLEADGLSRAEAVDQALADIAEANNTNTEAILEQLGTTQETLTEVTTDISELTALVMQYEADGLERDEALSQAISDLSDRLGTSEENILAGLGETEETILNAIDEAQATITGDISELTELVKAYEEAGIERDDAILLAIDTLGENLDLNREELLDAIGESEETILDAISESEEETNTYLDYISDLIGIPSSEITQDDIDMVVDLLAEDEAITDFNADLARFDLNFDGTINTQDIELMGDGIEIPATGIYADIDELQGTVEAEAEETRGLMSAQNAFNAFMGAGDLMGTGVTEKAPDPVQLKYIYDFSDIFATPQQRGLFPSPYGAPQRQAAQQISQQRGIMSGPLNLGGLQGRPGLARGGKVDYDFSDEIMHIMGSGDS